MLTIDGGNRNGEVSMTKTVPWGNLTSQGRKGYKLWSIFPTLFITLFICVCNCRRNSYNFCVI